MLKNTTHILKGLEVLIQTGNTPPAINSIQYDSRKVIEGDMFIAITGVRANGHLYIDKAIEKGAKLIIAEQMPENIKAEICYLLVKDTRLALAQIATAFYEHPSHSLTLVGVTGTNGKTSIATLLHQLLTDLGYVCGLISTIENKIGTHCSAATHTTPDPLVINALIKEMVDAGCEYCFMEVSSHALDQKRVNGLAFDGAIFTNLSLDHLDYHKTMPAYIKAKKSFFDMLSPTAFALVNKDDKNGMLMLQNCKAKTYSYALKNPADFKCKVMEMDFEGSLLNINTQELWCQLTGLFNAYNMTAIYASAILLQQQPLEVLKALSRLTSAAGRFQVVRSVSGKIAIVDYAHTPDALENVLSTIQNIKQANTKVITVIGCGGDRDKTKRPLMAQIATKHSWRTLLTSDNPRTESPEAILDDMMRGIDAEQANRVLRISQREEAIKTAALLCNPQDVILIAGKGHENYQEINGVKYHFDDTEIITNIFKIEK